MSVSALNSPFYGIFDETSAAKAAFHEGYITKASMRGSVSSLGTYHENNTRSKRSSMMSTSTTKSQLRSSNVALIDMLQNIQAELFAHRSIMLDIQSRVSHLENRPQNDTRPSRPVSGLLSGQGPEHPLLDLSPRPMGTNPEAAAWWEACSNVARNSDTPIAPADFLKTPRPVSNSYGPAPAWNNRDSQCTIAQPETPPETPKASPKFTAEGLGIITPPDSSSKTKTVEVEVKELPPAPILQLPPTPETKEPSEQAKEAAEQQAAESAIEKIVEKSGGDLLPSSPVLRQPPLTLRMYKGKRSLATFEARLKHKKTEKGTSILENSTYAVSAIADAKPEHVVLIHFHNQSMLADIE